MEKSIKTKVYEKMLEILPDYPNGIRAVELQGKIHEQLGGKSNTIGSRMKDVSDEYAVIVRDKTQGRGKGTYYSLAGDFAQPVLAPSAPVESNETVADASKPKSESDFYDSFSKFLKYPDDGDSGDVEYLEECTKTEIWGDKKGSPLRKWGNPDVIGVFKPEATDAIEFPHEIVSAEIKIYSTNADLLTGFAQTCVYRLFSHKVYLVVPDVPLGHLEALCHLHGIGLVVFDPEKTPEPSIFRIKLRARKQEPDTYYLNEAIPKDIIKKLYR